MKDFIDFVKTIAWIIVTIWTAIFIMFVGFGLPLIVIRFFLKL